MSQSGIRQCATIGRLLTLAFITVMSWAAETSNDPADKIQYNRDVRPILAETCFACHGPDKAKRKGKLGIDTRDDALKALDSGDGVAIKPGDPHASQLIARLLTTDIDDRMPPKKSGKIVTPAQIAILTRWIEQGAEYQPHWAYVPPTLSAAPTAKNSTWAITDVDRFLLSRMEKNGLNPADDADKPTLLRRLSFDLIGLPPTSVDLNAFIADQSPGAYERQVERLLASPHFGERLAVYWLDIVRYADSIGYHSDNPRNVSPFRDYVIHAFNADLPFNQFTIEQIAGDLLPNATLNQQIASGYNRLLMSTEEGGAQAKEYEAKNAADRVRSVSGAWLGSTMGCAECHDHKYDPISTRDFYTMAAFFADVKENAIGRRADEIMVPNDHQSQQLEDLNKRIESTKILIATDTPELTTAQAQWESQKEVDLTWSILKTKAITANGTKLTAQDDGSYLASQPADKDVFTINGPALLKRLTGIRIETLSDMRLPASGPGNADNGNFVLNEVVVTINDKKLKMTAAFTDHAQDDWAVAGLIDNKPASGWAILPETGKSHSAILTCAPTDIATDANVAVALHFSSPHAKHLIGRVRISLTNANEPAGALAIPEKIRDALKLASDKRSDEQRKITTSYFRSITPLLSEPRKQLADLEKQRAQVDATIARCLITKSAAPRSVRLLPRGDWQNDSGEVVLPATPHFLRQIKVADGQRATRLDLAQWLVATDNPLTARVFVNRMWKLLYGIGISRVAEDVGVQGEWPVHPELLDYLALRFQANWSVKNLIRLMVTSRAYRLSSNAEASVVKRDPFNRLVSHQGRWRLDAEFVRDNALAISGLLVPTIGGPSVKPYQPKGYWSHLNFPEREWENDTGNDAWRRGLYTWWQRTFPQPSLLAFDAPSREECTADRPQSNTPQQALVLLNDPTYVEAARAFAVRIMTDGGADDQTKITWAWRRTTARLPSAEEITVMSALLAKHRTNFAANEAEIKSLLSVGQFQTPSTIPNRELAAWISIARTLLNLHETITRN